MGTKFFRIVCMLTLMVSAMPSLAQNQDALAKISTAVKQMDDGQYDQSEALLQEVIALEPKNFNAWYELAYLYGLKKEHAEAMKTALKAAKLPGASDLAYQLAGTSADYMGDPKKAVELYKQGLQKFPDSGRLLLELGNMAYNSRNFNEALDYFEQGIAAEPAYPSNYLNATAILQNSSDPVWGLLYGEIFMNIERSGKRTRQMSRALYDIYRAALTFGEKDGERVVEYGFTQNNQIKNENGQLQIPFPIVYTMSMELAMPAEATAVDLAMLHELRSRFLEAFFDDSEEGTNFGYYYSNILFDYQRKVGEAGHFEAYNYWILGQGDQEALDAWVEGHGEQWDTFIDWFKANPMTVNKTLFMQRHHYDHIIIQ